MKMIFSILLFFLFGHAEAIEKCQLNEQSLIKHESIILNSIKENAKDPIFLWKKIEPSLNCMQSIAIRAPFILNIHAASYLRALSSGLQLEGLKKDDRYGQISQFILKALERDKSLLTNTFLHKQVRADWVFYKSFCTKTQQYTCVGLLPDKKDILSLSEVSAVHAVLILRYSLRHLDDRHRKQILSQIDALYNEVPATKKVLRQLVDEIYLELNRSIAPLSLVNNKFNYFVSIF